MPIIPQSSEPATVAATQIKASAVATFQHLVNVFATEARRFWRNPDATPADIAAALGTDGVEVFRLHGAIGQLLASIDPASIQSAAAMVGPFHYLENGTVVVGPAPDPVAPVVPPPPTPAPEQPDPEPTPDPDPTPEGVDYGGNVTQ